MKVATGERAAAQANIVVGRKFVFRGRPWECKECRTEGVCMQKVLVAKTGDIGGEVLVGFGVLYEVPASSGRFKVRLVHYPSKH